MSFFDAGNPKKYLVVCDLERLSATRTVENAGFLLADQKIEHYRKMFSDSDPVIFSNAGLPFLLPMMSKTSCYIDGETFLISGGIIQGLFYSKIGTLIFINSSKKPVDVNIYRDRIIFSENQRSNGDGIQLKNSEAGMAGVRFSGVITADGELTGRKRAGFGFYKKNIASLTFHYEYGLDEISEVTELKKRLTDEIKKDPIIKKTTEYFELPETMKVHFSRKGSFCPGCPVGCGYRTEKNVSSSVIAELLKLDGINGLCEAETMGIHIESKGFDVKYLVRALRYLADNGGCKSGYIDELGLILSSGGIYEDIREGKITMKQDADLHSGKCKNDNFHQTLLDGLGICLFAKSVYTEEFVGRLSGIK